MSGLRPALMHHALNELAGRVLVGQRLAPGDVLEGVIGGWPVVLEALGESGPRETVTWSAWFHRRRPEALAVVWPSSSTGLFDWQPGGSELVDAAQPREWREPVEHTGAAAPDPPWELPVPPDHLGFCCVHVLEEGAPVSDVARQSDGVQGEEDWTVLCEEEDHPADVVRVIHMAHLVRRAPSIRALAGLGLDEHAWRADAGSAWETARL